MSLDIGHIRARLSIDHSEWSRGIGQARGDLRQFGQDASAAGRDWNRIGQDMARMGSTLSRTVTPAMLGMGAGMLKVAGDTEAATARMGVTFAGLEDDMMGFLRDLQHLAPAAMAELQNSASSAMGALVTLGVEQGKANEMTKEALEVANALAAHMDIPFREALERVSRGYAGNTQGLRDMAFAINQADINARALELGLEGVEEGAYGSARALAVHSLVMEQMDGFMHAAEARVGTFNFELRQLWATLQDTGAAFGEIMLPAATQFVTFAGLVLEQLRGLDEGTQRFIITMGGVAAALGPALLAIGKLISLAPTLKAAWVFMAGPAAPFVLGATALAAGIYLIATNWDEVNARLPNTIGLLEKVYEQMQRINDISREDDGPGLFAGMLELTSEDISIWGDGVDALGGLADALLKFHFIPQITDDVSMAIRLMGSDFENWADIVDERTNQNASNLERLREEFIRFAGFLGGHQPQAGEPDPQRVPLDEKIALAEASQGHERYAQAVLHTATAQDAYARAIRQSLEETGRINVEVESAVDAYERLTQTLDDNETQLGEVNRAQDILRAEIERTGDPTRELTSMMLDLNRVERDLQQTIHETNLELAEKILALQDTSAATQDAIEPTSRFEQTLREGELAAHGMGGALLEMAAAADESASHVANLAEQYDFLHGVVDTATSRVSHWNSMVSDAEKAIEFLDEQIEKTGDSTGELTEKKERLVEWLGRAEGGVADEMRAFVDAQVALGDYHQAHDDLRSMLADGLITQEEYNEAVERLNDQFRDTDVATFGEAMDQATGLVGDLITAIRDLLIEIGYLDESDPEVSISVDDQEAIERTASMQDRADTLADTEIHLVPTVDETQAVADILFLEQNIDNIPDSTETVAHFDASQPNQELPRLRGLIDGIPKSFTITPSVNLLPALNSFEVLRAHMPSSPAEMGPFSVEPDWDWLFQGLSFSAEQHTDATMEHLQRLADRIHEAWSGPSASSVAGAIVQGLEESLDRLPGMVSHITPDVLVEFEIMRAGIQDELTLAEIIGEPERIEELRAKLEIIKQVAIAWAAETGIGMGDALGSVLDADRIMEEWARAIADQEEMEKLQKAIDDAWISSLGRFDDILSGALIERLEEQQETLREQIAIAVELGLSEGVIEGLEESLASVTEEWERAGQIQAEAYKAGLIPEVNAVSDEHFDILHGMLEDAEDISSATVNSIIDAWRDGRMEFEQVARLLPESAIPHLQRLQQAWADEMVSAIVNGNEELYQSTKHWFDEIGLLVDGMTDKVFDLSAAWDAAYAERGMRRPTGRGGGASLRADAGGGTGGGRGGFGLRQMMNIDERLRTDASLSPLSGLVQGTPERAALDRLLRTEFERLGVDAVNALMAGFASSASQGPGGAGLPPDFLVQGQMSKEFYVQLRKQMFSVHTGFDDLVGVLRWLAGEEKSGLGAHPEALAQLSGALNLDQHLATIASGPDAIRDMVRDIEVEIRQLESQLSNTARGGAVLAGNIHLGMSHMAHAVDETNDALREQIRELHRTLSQWQKLDIGGRDAMLQRVQASVRTQGGDPHGPIAAGGVAGQPIINQTINGIQPGDVQRETQRALRITATNWGTN